MRRQALIFMAGLILGAAAYGLIQAVIESGMKGASAPERPPLIEAVAVVDDVTSTPIVPETVPTPVISEERAAPIEPQPFLPPPSLNLSGATLGRQRVPGSEAIGDIHQLYFYVPRQELLMTVTEPDDLRSVWRLDERGKFERVFVASGGKGDIFIHGDSRGNVYVQHDNSPRLYRSTDGFRNWQEVSVDPPAMFWSIADDGNGTLYGTSHEWNTAVLYRSTDDGFNWWPWVDFQKVYPEEAVTYRDGDNRFRLRHLHDVIYDQLTKRIMVGVGDVARFTAESTDDGKTWKKIWNEGFTGHALVGDIVRYLMCPDRLSASELVLYDALKGEVKEVWKPAKYGFAGYCYSVIKSGETYYAAFHTEANETQSLVPKSGIIVSPDAENWYPFMEWGPLNHHARTNLWMAQGSNIIYASLNGALYAFRPLDKNWFADKTPFK